MTDEELQSGVENGNRIEGRDALAYQRVIQALRREPDFVLPPTFANRVINRLKTSPAQASHDLFWLFAGVAACLLTMVVAVVLTDFKFTLGAFRFVSGYPGLVTFAIGFILGLQWLDRKFVRKTI